MVSYDPARFSGTFQTENGRKIWEGLIEDVNIVRMETATYLGRPAAEALSQYLLERFGEAVRSDRTKQMIGHMIRQILEARGYRVDRGNVKISNHENIFSSATRYVSASTLPKTNEAYDVKL